jgi:hypothetical protein
MAQALENPCSPYLLKRRRKLRVACKQINRARGMATPCGPCEAQGFCAREMCINPEAVSRTQSDAVSRAHLDRINRVR